MGLAHYQVSIIICTCNRAEDLRQTLAAIKQVSVPEAMPTELLIVDNASSDHTADVVAACKIPHIPVRYVYEPRQGKGYAYNRGMAEAQGEIFLFTDDDVHPLKNWIAGMSGPILEGKADAVVGGIRIARHLERKWMQPLHRGWLASTAGLDPKICLDTLPMIGANMAFSRQVLTQVPEFDTELGAGALGNAEDTLFSMQLRQAGYQITTAFDIEVEHYFEVSRLTRRAFLDAARKRGQSRAYLEHHWENTAKQHPARYLRRALVTGIARLAGRRILHQTGKMEAEGAAAWEMELVEQIWFCRQFLKERRRIPNYEPLGLVKKHTSNVKPTL